MEGYSPDCYAVSDNMIQSACTEFLASRDPQMVDVDRINTVTWFQETIQVMHGRVPKLLDEKAIAASANRIVVGAK